MCLPRPIKKIAEKAKTRLFFLLEQIFMVSLAAHEMACVLFYQQTTIWCAAKYLRLHFPLNLFRQLCVAPFSVQFGFIPVHVLVCTFSTRALSLSLSSLAHFASSNAC